MFHGVRVGGNERLHASFSWSFGRQTLEEEKKKP